MPGRYRSLQFRPGRVVITPGALRALQEAGQDAVELLGRHLAGDWGLVCAADKQANDAATPAQCSSASAVGPAPYAAGRGW